MTPRPQLRLTKSQLDEATSNLNLTEKVTILLVSDSTTTTTKTTTTTDVDDGELDLPQSPYVSKIEKTDITKILSNDFLTCNTSGLENENGKGKTNANDTTLVGYTIEDSNLSHHLNMTILRNGLLISIPKCQVSSVGLTMMKEKKHLRCHDLPSGTLVPFTDSGGIERTKWALGKNNCELVNNKGMYLSCGKALMKLDALEQDKNECITHKNIAILPVIDQFNVDCNCWPNIQYILNQSNDVNDVLSLIDYIQWLSSCYLQNLIQQPEVIVSSQQRKQNEHITKMNIKRISYTGLCNTSLIGSAFEFIERHQKKQKLKCAIVIAQPPHAHGVWKGGVHSASARAGDVGFSSDAGEIHIVFESKVFKIQMRPACDAV